MHTNATVESAYHSLTAERLAGHLRTEAERAGGDLYVEGTFIPDDVGLSPGEIDALLLRLQGSGPGLCIERWSDAAATTWRVSVV